jgi:hypothetical protein
MCEILSNAGDVTSHINAGYDVTHQSHSEPPSFHRCLPSSAVKIHNNNQASATSNTPQRAIPGDRQLYDKQRGGHETIKMASKTPKTAIETVKTQGRKSTTQGTDPFSDAKANQRAKNGPGRNTMRADAKTTNTTGKMPFLASKDQ